MQGVLQGNVKQFKMCELTNTTGLHIKEKIPYLHTSDVYLETIYLEPRHRTEVLKRDETDSAAVLCGLLHHYGTNETFD